MAYRMNDRMDEQGMLTQPGEDNNVQICFIVLIVIIIVGPSIGLIICAMQEKDESSQNGKVSCLTSGPDADTSTRIGCINEQTINCTNSSCFSCKYGIVPSFDPVDCEGKKDFIQNMKNESCFQCKNDCLTYQDLLDKVKKNMTRLTCSTPVEISCCVLATMGNLGQNLGGNGKCECYTETVHVDLYNKSQREPICTCPVGSCDKTYTETERCKCLKSTHKFCEQTIKCDSERIRSNWTKCHRVITKDASEYNCMCTKPTATEPVGVLRSCSDLDST